MKIGTVAIISLVLLAAGYFLSRPDERLRVVFCDVGQGDGILVVKGRAQMIIDVGPDNGKMRRCLEKHLPFWDRTVEVGVISHWDKDHSGGLASVMKSYKIERLYSGRQPDGEIEQNIYTDDLRENDILRVNEIEIEIVGVGESGGKNNEASVVGVLKYKDIKILLTGDADGETEKRLVWRGLLRQDFGRLDVLKVGHHGAREGTSRDLLEAVRPKLAVISVGKNKFGHPSEEVTTRLAEFGVEIKRTDRDGDIVAVY